MTDVTTFERFAADAEQLEHVANSINFVLAAINSLGCIPDDLLDFLAVEVTRAQVERASSENDCQD